MVYAVGIVERKIWWVLGFVGMGLKEQGSWDVWEFGLQRGCEHGMGFYGRREKDGRVWEGSGFWGLGIEMGDGRWGWARLVWG